MARENMSLDDLLHYFFMQYVEIVAGDNFHVDGWEEVWTFRNEISGEQEPFPPSEWQIDPAATKLTAHFWNNSWHNSNSASVGHLLGRVFTQQF